MPSLGPSGDRSERAQAVLPVRTVELDWRSVATMLATFVAIIAITGFVRSVPRSASALAVAVILALALNPAVSLLQRRLRLPRSLSVGAIMLAVALLFAAIGLLLVPPAVRQARDLSKELPSVVADLGKLPLVGDQLVKADAPARLERGIRELPSRLAGDTTPLENAALRLADGLLAAVLTLLLTVTLLIDGPRLVRATRRLIPAARQARADTIGDLAYRVVGRYVAGSLTVAGVAGITVLIAGLLLGVPLTPMAAMWVAMWDLVPQIGGAMGGIPFVLLGLTQGVGVGLICLVFFLVYLQIENHILGPLLVGKSVKLSPPATMTAALIGVSAGGVVGALLAVPAVGAAKAIYLEQRPPKPSVTIDG